MCWGCSAARCCISSGLCCMPWCLQVSTDTSACSEHVILGASQYWTLQPGCIGQQTCICTAGVYWAVLVVLCCGFVVSPVEWVPCNLQYMPAPYLLLRQPRRPPWLAQLKRLVIGLVYKISRYKLATRFADSFEIIAITRSARFNTKCTTNR